jgi:hypothetical protein
MYTTGRVILLYIIYMQILHCELYRYTSTNYGKWYVLHQYKLLRTTKRKIERDSWFVTRDVTVTDGTYVHRPAGISADDSNLWKDGQQQSNAKELQNT